MTTPPDSGHEPADLSELTATDALLDRLGARNTSDADLLDPAAAVLAELVAVIDQAREPDVDAARLIEVLAGRPLYIAGADPAANEPPLIIDLTEPGNPADGADTDGAEVGSVEPLVPATRLPPPAVIPIRIPASEPVGPRRWDRVLSHASLPAASVLLLLAIGGGVSAAVTGDPMTPVNGITRVMAQLPGVDNSLNKVKSEISMARKAVRDRDTPLATMHLNRARAGLADVPAADKSQLSQQITEVEIAILVPSTPPTIPGESGVGTPGGSGSVPIVITTSAPASAQPSASSNPTASATAPEPSSEPSSEPTATSVPTSPDPVATSEAPADDPTAAASPTSP